MTPSRTSLPALPRALRRATGWTAIALAFAGLAHAPQARAADEAIVTDRPDFVESSDVVGRGRFQIETGYQSGRTSSGGLTTRTRTTPTLLRIGVGETVELRAETDGFAHQSADGQPSASGFSDWSLGAKWHMRDGDEEHGMPSIGWLLHADLDEHGKSFRAR
ncbi:MAG: transporter [Proteobacteria bacterium]|nr:transporter [Pseudomonadota bacterium]